MNLHASYFMVVVTLTEYVSRILKFTVGRKGRMQIKREMVYSQIKEIVPLGVSLIDEKQISRVQLTRQAERGRYISQDWG